MIIHLLYLYLFCAYAKSLNDNDVVLFKFPSQKSAGIIRIHKYQSDTLEFDYVAEDDGWLVMHYPYDKKWKITRDGKQHNLYKANYSFMAIPVKKGSQRLLLQYWRDTYLRFFIGLSFLFSQIVIWFIIYTGIKQESYNF